MIAKAANNSEQRTSNSEMSAHHEEYIQEDATRPSNSDQ